MATTRETRRARRAFVKKYGQRSYEVAKALLKGDRHTAVMWCTGTCVDPAATVNTYMSNLGRSGPFREAALACDFAI